MSTFKTNSKRAQWAVLSSIDSATFTGSYQLLTTTTQPGALIKFVNNSTVDVTFSTDGTHDNDFIPKASFCIYDFGSDAQGVSTSERMALSASSQIWVKGSAGTGLFYFVLIFQGE
jgi:hypothetical protein